jgi:hypothetical protein
MAATEMSKNHILDCHSDPAGPMWIKIGTVKRLDHRNKPIKMFFFNLQIWPHMERSNVKIWPNFAQNHVWACHSDPSGPMWTKIGTVKRLHPRNKPVKVFFKNLQIWPHTKRSNIKIWPNFAPKSRFGVSFEICISDQHKIAYGLSLYPYNGPTPKLSH